MNDLLIRMIIASTFTALGLSLLGGEFAVGAMGGSDTIMATFGLSLGAVLILVPIAYAIRSRRDVPSLVFNAFLLRLLAVVAVALVILPYYAARNSADAAYYDTQAGLIVDQIRTGAWSQLDMQAGTYMVSFVTALLYLPFGPSAAGMTFVSGMLGFVGSLCFVGAAAESLPSNRLRQYAFFVMMLPSVVFWSTLFGKDSWVFLGLGTTALGTAQWLRNRSWSSMIKMLFGLGIAFAFRPYVGLVALLSLALATFASGKSYSISNPLSFVKSATVLLLLVPMMLFMWKSVSRMTGITEVSEDSIVGRISQQGVDTRLGGGSDTDSVEIQGTRAFVSQLPEGVIRLLFRPWPWEATSFFMFAAALDNVVLIVVLIARRRNLIRTFRNIRTQPYAFFCLILAIGLAVVFSTIANLGLVMRQKTQITPFLYFLAFAGDKAPARRRKTFSAGEVGAAWPARVPVSAPLDSRDVATPRT